MKINEIINKIRIATFRYKDKVTPNNKKYFGVMAQDLAKILDPEEYSVVRMEEDGFYAVDYIQLVPLLIKHVQELEKRIDDLEHWRNK